MVFRIEEEIAGLDVAVQDASMVTNRQPDEGLSRPGDGEVHRHGMVLALHPVGCRSERGDRRGQKGHILVNVGVVYAQDVVALQSCQRDRFLGCQYQCGSAVERLEGQV